MKAQPLPRPIPCIITALELIGLDDPMMPPGRVRHALALVESSLADPDLTRLYRSRLSVSGRHLVHIAPIRPSGLLPFHAALSMVHLQADLLPLGVLVRGAIAIGLAAARGSTLFGQGIADTERLRDEVALVPRVLVHPQVLREVELNADLRAVHHSPIDELGYLRSLLLLDTDGLWFVDYLRGLQSEVEDPEQYREHLKEHHRLVTRKLEASTVLDRSSRAWSWLWRYHNLVVADLSSKWRLDDQEIAELRIPASSPLLYKFPSVTYTVTIPRSAKVP